MPDAQAVAGIDFGTSNTALAIARNVGPPRLASFSLLGRSTQSFRSLLYFDPEEQNIATPIRYEAGVGGIEAYLEAMGEGRLIQSFKTHLTTATLGRTQIGPHTVDLDGMLALFLRRFRVCCERSLGTDIRAARFGCPVRFAGATTDQDNEYARSRLKRAGEAAGFEVVSVELEPIAAAYHHEQHLQGEQLALVADFGGGTTDFCVMRLGSDRRKRTDRRQDILATGGISVAGDNLDAAIIDNLVAPALGKGTTYREMGHTMAIPPSYYHKLSRWHKLSFLRTARVLGELERLRKLATQPEAIEALVALIEENQGFYLHESVEAAKIALSHRPEVRFHYKHGELEISCTLKRRAFEGWIADDVTAIAACLDDTLGSAGVSCRQIGRVFMTGGTAFVPSIRSEFLARFGADKLSGGDELSSIASGLALRK
ncbi:MAG: Hsp70 family protein [Nannocystaceae bacterium]